MKKRERHSIIQAQVSFSDDGSIMYIKTPWSREFVDALKSSIPWTHRKWNGKDKLWEITGGYHTTAQELIDTYYDGQMESVEAQPLADLYRVMFLAPGAPEFVITAVYVALGEYYNSRKEFDKFPELVATYGAIIEHIHKQQKHEQQEEVPPWA